MRLNVNLANDPFRNRTTFWLVVSLAFFVAAVAGVAVVARSGAIDADAEQLAKSVTEQETEIANLEEQLAAMRSAQESAILTPGDRVALDEARGLINQKSFAWSRLLVELEHYLPARSRLTSIDVGAVDGFGPDRVVNVRVQFEGLDQRQVADMLVRFDQSGGRFRAEPVSIEPSEDGPSVAYALAVQYRPGVAADAPLPAAARYMTSNQGGALQREEEDEDE
jgi:hypothetical protein